MHILINGMFWREPNTGSGQYLHGLLRAMPQVAPQHRYTLLLPAPLQRDSATISASWPMLGVTQIEVRTPLGSGNAAKLWFEQRCVPEEAKRVGADLVFVPYAAAPLACPVPVVTTVHDIIWHLLPEYRGKAAFRAYAQVVIAATRRASHVLADSEHSRRDIIEYLRIAPERVTTVLLAAGEQYRPLAHSAARAEVAARYGIDGPFVYYVGGLDARKNVPLLLRAWSILRRSGGPRATLVIAGKPLSSDRKLFPELDPLIAELQLGESVRRIEVPRADGPLLYNAAIVFVFPSRYEGFGLGPLEAMACGTPVICSNASSLPEVVGDAAITLPPDDPAAWATAMWRVLSDETLRDELTAGGLRRAAQFSYTQVARETVAVLERFGR